MSHKWLITGAEEEKLRGITCEAKVIYLLAIRPQMDFDTGIAQVSFGTMKRSIEYIPDWGSKDTPRRVGDFTDNYIRARLDELQRAELIQKIPKASRFEPPSFRCNFAVNGLIRPEKEQRRNHKERTTSGSPTMTPDRGEGTTKEPQGRNNKISGNPDKNNPQTPSGTCKPQPTAWQPPPWIDQEAWSDFEQHRRDLRKPLTDLARQKAANQLRGLSHSDQRDCIDKSIQAGWTGLFPDSRSKTNGNQPTYARQQAL